jgi:hypothetical protein
MLDTSFSLGMWSSLQEALFLQDNLFPKSRKKAVRMGQIGTLEHLIAAAKSFALALGLSSYRTLGAQRMAGVAVDQASRGTEAHRPPRKAAASPLLCHLSASFEDEVIGMDPQRTATALGHARHAMARQQREGGISKIRAYFTRP